MILIRLNKLLKIQEILHINTYKTFIQINIQIIKLFLWPLLYQEGILENHGVCRVHGGGFGGNDPSLCGR